MGYAAYAKQIFASWFIHLTLRSAPASPTHGLQFHAPPAPVTHVPRENSPTKTVTQAADAAGSQAKATPTSPPIIPASGLPPPVPSLPSTVLKQSAALQAIAAQMAGAALPVSVIKSSLEAVKEGDGAESEKNGFSQSSGDESPVENTLQPDAKTAVSKPMISTLVKPIQQPTQQQVQKIQQDQKPHQLSHQQQIPLQFLAGAAAPSAGKCVSVCFCVFKFLFVWVNKIIHPWM